MDDEHVFFGQDLVFLTDLVVWSRLFRVAELRPGN